mmetsp:Transcript_7786/g.8753  ORF Transcript_7786/g.8753 Transcript_7786/m.8753 type:complete len:101 (+) Transcript_7786:171-473(+)
MVKRDASFTIRQGGCASLSGASAVHMESLRNGEAKLLRLRSNVPAERPLDEDCGADLSCVCRSGDEAGDDDCLADGTLGFELYGSSFDQGPADVPSPSSD